MKAKTFVILSAILVVVLAAGALIIYQKSRPNASLEMGAPMIAEIPAGDIAAISIETPTETIELENGNMGWVVRTRFDYPADFSRIKELVQTVRDAKIGRSFDSTESVRNRLALVSPVDSPAAEGKRGTLVEMKNEKGELIAGVLLGETRKRGGQGDVSDGHYVMLNGSQSIYLVDKMFTSFETGNSSWLAKTPVQINGEDIAEISCEGPAGAGLKFVFKRDKKGGEYQLTFPSSEKKVDRSSLNRMSNALSSLQIDDVQLRTSEKKSAQPPEPEVSDRIHFTLFDGTVYHVYPDPACSETGPCRLKIDVGWEKPEDRNEKEGKDAPAGTEKGGEEKQTDAAVRAAQENERMSRWVFVIPKWRHDAFITDLQELIEQDKEEKKE